MANNDEDPYGTTQRPEAPWVNSKVNGMTPAEIALDADDVALKVKTEVRPTKKWFPGLFILEAKRFVLFGNLEKPSFAHFYLFSN